jgi:hypothetical protein
MQPIQISSQVILQFIHLFNIFFKKIKIINLTYMISILNYVLTVVFYMTR